MTKPHILALATAVPPHVCTQAQTIAVAHQVFHDDAETRGFVERLVRGSGIRKRHTVLADYACAASQRTLFASTPDFRPEPGTHARNQVFAHEAPRLAQQACAALPSSGWPGRVTHLLTASCTGFTAPGFDVALARALGLSPRLHRIHVGFMGCYAGFSTLKMAQSICSGDPAALVLVVHVELCSLHVHFATSPDSLVANVLFADGAAAALVGGDRHLALGRGVALAIEGNGALLLPGGEQDMTWSVGDHGFTMTLSPRVPRVLRQHLAPALSTLLDQTDSRREQVRHWAIHPGGPAILEQAAKALDLDEGALAASRQVLAEYGNMSSSTLWFVLEAIRRQPAPGLIYACGFGPGLTLESALLSHPGAG